MKSLKNLEPADHVGILWKRRWYFLVTAMAVSSAIAAWAWKMSEVYKSETRVMVEAPLVEDRSTARVTAEDRINSIRQQLASRTFLERMIEEIPMFGYGRDPNFQMEWAVKQAQKQVGIEKTSENTFTLSYLADTPGSAQKVAKALADELIRQNRESRRVKIANTDQFIDDQLAQTRKALDDQDEKIKAFKMQHLGELPEQGSANINVLNGLHSQLSATESAIRQAQERLRNNDFKWSERKRLSQLSEDVATTNALVRSSGGRLIQPLPEEAELASKKALLVQYMAKYTPNHPDVVTLKRDIETLEQQIIAKISASKNETATAVDWPSSSEQKPKAPDAADLHGDELKFEADSIKAEIDRLEKDKQALLQDIKIYQNRLNLAPRLEQELTTLLRDEDVLKAQLADLQKKKFTTQMADAVENDTRNETYKIIDEANRPLTPQYPNKTQIALMGFLGGLLLGIGAAYGRELLDGTIGSEEEAKALLNFPVLASIPAVPKERKPRKLGRRIA